MGNCLGTSEDRDTQSTAGTSDHYGNSRFLEAAAMDDAELDDGEILVTPNLKVFTLSDLKSATRNFKADHLLGEGGFGKVYKGWMDEKTLAPSQMGTGMVVAIKKLNSEGVQGFDEWQSEVNFLVRLSHPNIVRLFGYCWEDKELLLVYEFMQRGSLENHLFKRNPSIQPLSWDKRLKIAIGAARGLAFLHTSEKQVIYRDFKASNILLDWHYNAKISDFGLAKLGPSGGESHLTTRVMGTYGYAAPEYVTTGQLCVKSDVYGFGVVLLELLTGRRALDMRRPKREQNLVEWAKPFLSQTGKVKNILDPLIQGQFSSKVAFMTAKVALKCLAGEARKRPSMKEVVDALEQISAVRDRLKEAKVELSPQPSALKLQPIHFQRSPRHSNDHGSV